MSDYLEIILDNDEVIEIDEAVTTEDFVLQSEIAEKHADVLSFFDLDYSLELFKLYKPYTIIKGRIVLDKDDKTAIECHKAIINDSLNMNYSKQLLEKREEIRDCVLNAYKRFSDSVRRYYVKGQFKRYVHPNVIWNEFSKDAALEILDVCDRACMSANAEAAEIVDKRAAAIEMLKRKQKENEEEAKKENH